MRYPRYPYGCNMSVRRETAEQIGGFSARLGRKKSSLISNEEKYFFYKIDQMGGQVTYTPAALVHHLVPPKRLSQDFFLRRGYAQGISNILFQTETSPVRRRFWWHLRQVAVGMRLLSQAAVGMARHRLHGRNGAGSFTRRVRMRYCLGYMAGAARGAGRAAWKGDRNNE